MISWAIIPINVCVFWAFLATRLAGWLFVVFSALCVLQLIAGIYAFVDGIRRVLRRRTEPGAPTGASRLVMGLLGAIGAIVGWFGVVVVAALGSATGGAWGRPLRVRGRQLHPELTDGADWTAGERPARDGLDPATCAALEALWLHDAQKEHASVPAFSRVSWLLAAVGAPPELAIWCHRAALEEIDHAQRCFALAAGYGGRSFTVEPMPDLLLGGLGDVDDPLRTLAIESLTDGCLLEDFNADVAARCAELCEAPATHRVLLQIAREERSHAEFSWATLSWLLARHRERVAPALADTLDRLDRVARPTAATAANQALVDAADAAALRRHGRIDDRAWRQCWTARVAATRDRARELLRADDADAASRDHERATPAVAVSRAA